MTYAQLLARLQKLNPEQLDQDVTIYLPDEEFLHVDDFHIAVEDDILDQGHPYLAVESQ